ncbi:MAG TPA: hypothetical protein VKW78_13930 [Terriglobales bacterium]|nr:hypothetical protein [Terriglobales bacterium]
MMRNLMKSKFLLMGGVVLLAAVFASGCETTFYEKSGKMPNENTSQHVQGYQSGNSDSIRLVLPLPVLR